MRPITRQSVCGNYSHIRDGQVDVAFRGVAPPATVTQVSAAMSMTFPAASIAATLRLRGVPHSDAGFAAPWFGETLRADAMPAHDMATEPLDMRQLRHQTKNALQRVLGVLMATPQEAGGEWAEDAGRRIRLSAEISNALFGFTQAPEPMQKRLEKLAAAVVALMSAPGQTIGVQVLVDGDCPAGLRGAVIQVAHEFVANAMKHGFPVRTHGTIRIALARLPGSPLKLLVSDNGCGVDPDAVPGEGLGIAGALALRMGGTVTLRQRGVAEAEMLVPVCLGEWSAWS